MSPEVPQSGSDSAQKIKTTPNISTEEAIALAVEDNVFSSQELEALKERFAYEEGIIDTAYLESQQNIRALSKRLHLQIIGKKKIEQALQFWEQSEADGDIDTTKEALTILGEDRALKKVFFFTIAENNPAFIFEIFEKFRHEPYAQELILSVSEREVFFGFNWIDRYKGEEPLIATALLKKLKNKDLLLDLAETFSFGILKHFDKFKSEPYAKELLLKIIEKVPFFVLSGFDKFKSESYAKEALLKGLKQIDIKSLPSHQYLTIGVTLNNLHNEKEDIRFMIISEFDENILYKLIVHGRSEVFTSTYNGIINRFIAKGKNIYEVAQTNNFEGLVTFIEAAASYGRLDELLIPLSDDQKKKLIDKVFDEQNLKGETGNYVAIMEVMNNVQSPELLQYMGEKIKANYMSVINKNTWGIIAKYVAGKFKDDPFFKSIPDIYKLPDIKGISSNDLFDSKGRNVQQYFFYNDKDGKNSYESFIRNYKGSSEWTIADKGSFIIITSKPKNEKSITIYANKPENDGDTEGMPNGFEAAKQDMNSQKPPLESLVVVHRGHSYHAQKTIDRIPPIAKMVFLGSCGGFQDIGEVLDKSGNAQIISTKGTGTMMVNDPLFKAINEQILSGKDIVWEDIWKKITPRLKNNKDFGSYVRPDQNLGALFYKKKKDLEKGEG